MVYLGTEYEYLRIYQLLGTTFLAKKTKSVDCCNIVFYLMSFYTYVTRYKLNSGCLCVASVQMCKSIEMRLNRHIFPESCIIQLSSELQYIVVLLGFVVCLYTYCGGQKINPYIMAYISFLLALKRCSVVLLSFFSISNRY